jgi:hypothetical protein
MGLGAKNKLLVMRMRAQGKEPREIAQALLLSPKVVVRVIAAEEKWLSRAQSSQEARAKMKNHIGARWADSFPFGSWEGLPYAEVPTEVLEAFDATPPIHALHRTRIEQELELRRVQARKAKQRARSKAARQRSALSMHREGHSRDVISQELAMPMNLVNALLEDA